MSASRPDAPPLPRPVPALAPAARPTGATLLAEQLRGEIVAGHIPPGSRYFLRKNEQKKLICSFLYLSFKLKSLT